MQRLSADALRALAKERAGEPVVLREHELEGASLRGIELSGWTFQDCVLDDAVFTRSNLSRCIWRGGSARRAKLIDADLVDTQFHGVDLSAARLTGSLLTDALFDGCRAMGAYFDRSRGLGMTFRGSNLYGANLDGASFGGNALLRNRFDDATLRKADLHDCVLDESTLNGTDLTGANLRGTDLRGAVIGECDADRLACLDGALINADQAVAILASASGVIVV